MRRRLLPSHLVWIPLTWGDAMRPRLLLVEDDPTVRRSIAETLSEEGFEVSEADGASAALGLLGEFDPEVVLSDVRMPGMDGIELLRLLQERAPEVDVVLMTAYDDMATVARAMREGAFDFLVKPLKLGELRTVLTRLLDDRRSREQARRVVETEAQAYRLDSLVGRDSRMIEVYKKVGQLAASTVTVLIRGETGTGKGMAARAIHYNSESAGEPFISVNCTALPESLLESELFGHVRGSFTGAISDRRGRFALAGRGTIFLDEVGDTSTEFQAKLLRVLEDHEFYPVGAEQVQRTEARVIAATHRNLEGFLEQGRFREDLYYRLRVVEMLLPPLRERIEDIPLLARHFVKKAAAEFHRSEAALSDQAITALLRHDWPGNVRELENCITRAVVLATGDVIREEHLALGERTTETARPFPSLDEIEAEHLARALAFADGNKTKAADLMRVSKPRLYRMIEKYGIG
ncbi:MAG: sigma-54 dependent transcriptional regulator [Gemmatimonadota bacterium]